MSFWEADDKIPITQKSVSIPSSNGLNYSGGQRIVIDVPATIEYVQPKESYLKFDFKIALPAGKEPTKLQLDETLGLQSIIRDIRIYSGGAGKILLEEYQNYNVLTNIKYSYETNDVLRAKRSMTEGATCHSVKTRGTCGTTESHKNSIAENPYFSSVTTNSSSTWSDGNFLSVKALLPINTGLFSNSKILPVLMLEGLTLDIILENSNMVFRQLDQVRQSTTLANCPIYHSTNGSLSAGVPADTARASGTAADLDTIFLASDNMITSVENVPFCVGESIAFSALATGAVVTPTAPMVISEISACTTNNLIQLDFASSGQVATSITGQGTYVVTSNAVVGETSYDATYVVSNMELVLQQLEMPQGYTAKMRAMMKEGGSMNYDFLSFTNYKYSQLSSDTVANIRLPLNMSRAKAILCCPVDSSTINSAARIAGVGTYETYKKAGTPDNEVLSDKTGLVGIVDNLQDYQFFYDGKLNPSRKVSCSRTATKGSISQQPIIELEKALSMSEIIPYSFMDFQKNLVLGRALSLHNGVYDTRGKDFNLQVEYTGAVAPTTNKLWNSFVAHIRRIEFRGDGISLQV